MSDTTTRRKPAALTVTTLVAAERLAAELDGTAERWRAWLEVQARRGVVGDVQPEPGRGERRWPARVIDDYIARHKAVVAAVSEEPSRAGSVIQAYGLADPGVEDGYGRRADMSAMGLLTEAHEPFVRVLSSKPLVAWRLSVAQAQQLAEELQVAIADAQDLARVAAR